MYSFESAFLLNMLDQLSNKYCIEYTENVNKETTFQAAF